MKKFHFNLYLEINDSKYIFFVEKSDGENYFEIDYKLEVPLEGIINNRVANFEKSYNVIKENIYLLEEKFKCTFKELILILENLSPTFLNLSGYKKLNGSQISKENIIYILNTCKSIVNEIESNKKILHIFNSKYNLDNQKVENLPIGLFGDFYSHELSFILINKNDYKNLKNLFANCNLKIKKILVKNFVKGANISQNYKIETFFYLRISKSNSNIFYFENDSLKLEQNFSFGTDIIIKDISKITSLKKDTVIKILNEIEFKQDLSEDDLIEEEFFKEDNYIKIKKKLIYEIALARIIEILEIIVFKNINFKNNKKYLNNLFFEVNFQLDFKYFEEIFKKVIIDTKNFKLILLNNLSDKSVVNSANKIVHFGWKKEAIPVSQSRKSLIARFFDKIFG